MESVTQPVVRPGDRVGAQPGLTLRAGTTACSGESSAISSPQPPISPGHDSHTLFWISTGIKQNTVVLDKHFSTPVSMATAASLASHQHLWSRHIGDVPGKGHWECVHFNYTFCFDKKYWKCISPVNNPGNFREGYRINLSTGWSLAHVFLSKTWQTHIPFCSYSQNLLFQFLVH